MHHLWFSRQQIHNLGLQTIISLDWQIAVIHISFRLIYISLGNITYYSLLLNLIIRFPAFGRHSVLVFPLHPESSIFHLNLYMQISHLSPLFIKKKMSIVLHQIPFNKVYNIMLILTLSEKKEIFCVMLISNVCHLMKTRFIIKKT